MKQIPIKAFLQKLSPRQWWPKLRIQEFVQKWRLKERLSQIPIKSLWQKLPLETCKKWWPKIQKKIGSVLATLAVVISGIICVSVIVQVLTNGYVQMGNFSLFRVVTGSMEPELPVGTLLVCTKTDIDDIQEGDIICFRSRDPAIAGKIITHRVITVAQDSYGQRMLETKGDANLSADGEFVWASNLIGRVNHYAKDGHIMTSFVNILTDKIGFMMLVLFPTLLIAGFILRSCMNNMRHNIELALELERQAKEQKAKEEETAALCSPDEYAEMVEKIKNELLQEMEQGAEDHDEETGEPSKTE